MCKCIVWFAQAYFQLCMDLRVLLRDPLSPPWTARLRTRGAACRAAGQTSHRSSVRWGKLARAFGAVSSLPVLQCMASVGMHFRTGKEEGAPTARRVRVCAHLCI